MAGCMTENGWDVIATYDNAVVPADAANGIPPDQAGKYDEDMAACTTKFGYNGVREPSSAQLEEMYERDIAERQCLIDLGYSIPELPSYASYSSTFGKEGAWDVAGYVQLPNEQKAKEVWTKCPPPLWFPNY